MIELYAILRDDQTLQLCISNKKTKRNIEALYKHICKKIKNQRSKLVQTLKIQNFYVYYFEQDQFTFIIATKFNDRPERIQNYLRVVAEIFYENYDEKKFHIVLENIIRQINRIQFQKKNPTSEDEEIFLVHNNLPEYKDKFNNMIQKREKESKRVYVIMSVLFIAIFILLMVFICKKWC